MSKYTISTEQDNTGIAPGQFSWRAWFGDWDLGDPIGEGPTEAAAIADLIENYDCPWETT